MWLLRVMFLLSLAGAILSAVIGVPEQVASFLGLAALSAFALSKD